MALLQLVFFILFVRNLVHSQTIYCNSKDKCKDDTIICNDNRDDCTIFCTAESACSGNAKIIGRYAGDVTVKCTQKDACKGNTIIYCGTGHCDITCSQSTSCEDTSIIASTASSYSCRPTSNCNKAISDRSPFVAPTKRPTAKPTLRPTNKPIVTTTTTRPTQRPFVSPTNKPTIKITLKPTLWPTNKPIYIPTIKPTKLQIIKKPDHFPIYEVESSVSYSSSEDYNDFNHYFDDITLPAPPKKPFSKDTDLIKPDVIDQLDEPIASSEIIQIIETILPERTQNPSTYPTEKPTATAKPTQNPITTPIIGVIDSFTDSIADSKEFTVVKANPPPTAPSSIARKRSPKPSVMSADVQIINELNDAIVPPPTITEPTSNPLLLPTINPTTRPSLSPTTQRPTDIPSQNPSNNPSPFPTVRTKKPTQLAKFTVTSVPLTIETSRPTLLATIPTAKPFLTPALILPSKPTHKPSTPYIGDVTTNGLSETYGNLIKAAASTNQLSIFITSLITTGAVSKLLRPGSMSYTVFAPTDDAFNALMTEMDINLNEMLNLPNLSDILLYHAIANKETLSCEHLKNMNGENVSSLNGNSFEISVSDLNEISLFAQKNGISNVVACDFRAKNGILHLIDRVMLAEFNNDKVMTYDNDNDETQNHVLSDDTAMKMKSVFVLSLVGALLLCIAIVTILSWCWCRKKGEEGVQISINGEDSDVDDEIMEIIEKICQDTDDI